MSSMSRCAGDCAHVERSVTFHACICQSLSRLRCGCECGCCVAQPAGALQQVYAHLALVQDSCRVHAMHIVALLKNTVQQLIETVVRCHQSEHEARLESSRTCIRKQCVPSQYHRSSAHQVATIDSVQPVTRRQGVMCYKDVH